MLAGLAGVFSRLSQTKPKETRYSTTPEASCVQNLLLNPGSGTAQGIRIKEAGTEKRKTNKLSVLFGCIAPIPRIQTRNHGQMWPTTANKTPPISDKAAKRSESEDGEETYLSPARAHKRRMIAFTAFPAKWEPVIVVRTASGVKKCQLSIEAADLKNAGDL